MINTDIPIISDWSVSGRRKYLEKNQVIIDLVIKTALEELEDSSVSKVFGSIDKAVEDIKKRFLDEYLDAEKCPNRDLNLFSNINFWMQYKTRGNFSTNSRSIGLMPGEVVAPDEGSLECVIERISTTLKEFNKCVAPDMIGYWLKANKKFIDEVSLGIELDNEAQFLGSGGKHTKYKADASFRFFYVYLGTDRKVDDFRSEDFKSKYLARGDNKPQYTSNGYEDHATTDRVRKHIVKVIDFYSCHVEDFGKIELALMKPFAKKSLLDLYKIKNSGYAERLKNLTSIKELSDEA
jgi:hypothetical protein